jgi:hypothetical protein
MSNLIEAAPEEPGNGPSGSNRAFILMALGLAALLVIGLLLVFGYVAGTRLGLIGTAALVTPDATTVAVAATGTANAVVLAAATSAAGATLSPATTTAAGAGATAAAGGTRAPGAALTGSPAATTSDVGTPTPTRVVSGPGGTPSPAATNAAATSAAATRAAANTLAPGAPTPTNTPGGALTGSTAEVTPTPGGAGSGSNLPTTGVELDILVMGVLMIVLLVIARSFRMALHG